MEEYSTKSRARVEQQDENHFQQDFSVFRTQLPRPTSTARHLLLAGITFILALIAAIFYAER